MTTRPKTGNISNVIPAEAGNAYLYDKVGNRTSMMVTDSGGTRTHVYTYDNIYQITEVDYPSGFEYLATDTEFNYDAAGNRTSVIDGSGTCTYTTNSLNQYTAAGSTSYQYDDSGNLVHDADYAYGYDPENRLVKVKKSGSLPLLTLAEAVELPLPFTTGGDADWTGIYTDWYSGGDCARSGDLDEDQSSWLEATVEGPGTLTFWWKAPGTSGNELAFRIDTQLRSTVSDEDDWQEKSYEITGSGTHTLRWTYSRGENDGHGYVDFLQWTGTVPLAPEPATDDWKVLTYTYDASGRRIAKTYDSDTITKYVYDSDHCIAEYDASDNLRRKYIYGPSVDEPIAMIEAAGTYAGTYYYHFDGLGSVVALTDDEGDTVQVYEYDVYGRVGATDANHPNRIMFTGREYDKETGLYYYRARYYNPQIGRFLQTDPIGYGDGMNWYAYCGNNPIVWADPTGLLDIKIAFYDGDEPYPPQYGSKHPWEERADDFAPWYFNMGSTKDVKTVLEAIKWGNENMGWDLHITDIYFYDHCAYDVGKNFGMEFGDEWLPAGGPYDRTMFDFCQELKDLTPDDCNLNFRQCYVARDPGVLSDLATWSQRRVTGCEGIIADLWPATERPGPDYTMLGDLWFADPKKLERGRVWRVGEPNQPY